MNFTNRAPNGLLYSVIQTSFRILLLQIEKKLNMKNYFLITLKILLDSGTEHIKIMGTIRSDETQTFDNCCNHSCNHLLVYSVSTKHVR
jgi:hypothetical protein